MVNFSHNATSEQGLIVPTILLQLSPAPSQVSAKLLSPSDMPTTVRPRPGVVGQNRRRTFTASERLRNVSFKDSQRRILRASCTNNNSQVCPTKNGLVNTIIWAFQQDLHLELRPDDVWLGILTQLSFFVNGHAEDLRQVFVSHAGKRDISVDMRPQSLATLDVGFLARKMATAVQSQLQEPAIASKLMGDFTTTTDDDRAIAAMVFLGTMKQYLSYYAELGCGFPSVTLHGEREDWVRVRDTAAWLAELIPGNDEVSAWVNCLVKVLDYMVASFDRPDDPAVRGFWMCACHSAGQHASGETVVLSGWLNVFCWWRADGKRQRTYNDDELREMWHLYGPKDRWRLVLDGVSFPVINRDDIPAGFTRVPVTMRFEDGEAHKTVLLAGLVGMGIKDLAGTVAYPTSGWWMLDNTDE